MENSVMEMTKVFSNYVTNKKDDSRVETVTQPTLKFNYIWQNLDHLFQQMTQDQVNDLNIKFMNLAFEKIQNKQASDQ